MSAGAAMRGTGQTEQPRPRGPWVMAQTWHTLLFAHWPVPTAAITPLLPPGLTLDTYGGEAWLGVVPFRMSGVRPRGVPPLPWLSAFPELNVRTYVTLDGVPGVWFFSLDAANPLAVATARAAYHLPYFTARMRCDLVGDTITYASERTHRGAPPAELAAVYRCAGPIFAAAPGSPEHWLTERYSLYAADRRGRLWWGEIRHRPWPLQAAQAEISRNTMARAAGVALPDTPPLLHYAHRQDVRIWLPRRVAPGDEEAARLVRS
ncbi:MAG TPA: DUF2071 domain-containing protein [Ktedonobacterales bacterium]|nr:DUF2071 domain-containing protein [Ktedonobacterales bacterium]